MSEQLGMLSIECRRGQFERRQANLRSMLYALFMSRRKSNRRGDEAVCSYCDQYGPHVITAAILLMLFCVLDSYFTLLLIQFGSTELNPILAWALNKHVLFFFLLKYTLTSIFVFMLVIHKHFRVYGLKGRHVLLFCVMSYGVLIQYQLSMLLPALSWD